MKLKTLNILFLFFVITNLQAQVKGEVNYLVTYEVEFALDSTDRENRSFEKHRLYSNGNISYYATESRIKMDSLMQVMREGGSAAWRSMRGNMQNFRDSGFPQEVFKAKQGTETWVRISMGQDTYIYQEPKVPVVWEFTEESKEIGKYLAQKATTSFGGRDYEAWFTLQVPIADGPYVFSGLPGLILELYDTEEDYRFDVASIEQLKEPFAIDSKRNNVSTIEKEEFIKAYMQYRKNPFVQFNNRLPANFSYTDETGKTITKNDMMRTAKEEAEKRNNLIERW